MKIADGSEAPIPGKVEHFSIKVRGMTHSLTCLVGKNDPFHLITVRPAMKNVRPYLGFDKHIVTFKSGTKVAKVAVWSDKERGDQALTG